MFQISIAQVGIGTTNPSASLDIQSSNQANPSNTDGLLIPKIDEFPVSNPGANQDGMLVYVTGSGTPSKGFYYWDNATTAWVNVKGVAVETDPKVGTLASGYVPRWNGTTLEDGTIFNSGTNVGIGTATPTDELHVVGNIKMQDGNEAMGKVLTSDELGKASWEELKLDNFLSSPIEGDLSCPTLVNTITTGTWPSGVEVSGNYLYQVNGISDDMRVMDISNPEAPVLVGSVATGDEPKYLTLNGNYAYVLNWQGNNMQIIDISDPSMPVVVSTVGTGTWPSDVVVSGNYAYVTNLASNNMNVIDISNPMAPSVIATLTPGDLSARSLAISGSYLYLAMSNNLHVVNISNPSSPVVVNSISSVDCRSIEVLGNFLYKINHTSDNIEVFNISNPVSPTLAATVTTGDNPTAITFSESYAFILNQASLNSTLQIFDISNPNTPISVATIPAGPMTWSLAFSKGYVYVTNINHAYLQVFKLFCSENYAIAIDPSTGETNAIPFTDSLLKDEDEDTQIQVEENADDDIIRFDTAGSERMVIAANGKVGIGTTNPSSIIANSKLDVLGGHIAVSNNFGVLSFNSANTSIGAGFDTTPTDDLNLYAGGANRVNVFANGRVSIPATTDASDLPGSGVLEIANALRLDGNEIITNTNAVLYLNNNNNGDVIIDDNTFRVDASTNRVGIGTATPGYALHVASGNTGGIGANPSYYLHPTVGHGSSGSGWSYAIVASVGRIYAAGGFGTGSDSRIKTIKGISDSKEDLNKLMDIEITNYTYKDSIAKGNGVTKKVIAQQVKEVLPNAISLTTEFIPNIYTIAEATKASDQTLQLTFKNSPELLVDDIINLFPKDKAEMQARVVSVNKNVVVIAVEDADLGDEIFVYGKQIDDFHTVDYDAISMLNVSATQEQQKLIEALQSEVAHLIDENITLKSQVSRLTDLEQEMLKLKALILETDNEYSITKNK